ncbi:MAG: PIN domain-containing protein [Caldilineaceae bacterium]
MKYRIYLDTCCLNRPFDDQTQLRIRLETEAILRILEICKTNTWLLISSQVIEAEISQIADTERRRRVALAASSAVESIRLDESIKSRAEYLEGLGFAAFDALHLASAELTGVDILLTTDDRFVRLFLRSRNRIQIAVENPLRWITEKGETPDAN